MSRLKNLIRFAKITMAMALGRSKPKELFNKLAASNLRPEQVDGYVNLDEEEMIEKMLNNNSKIIGAMLQGDQNILEIGCGTGRYLARLSGSVKANFYGVDIADETIERYTKKNVPNATLASEDFTQKNPFPSIDFDMVYCITVLQYVKPWRLKRFLRNIFVALQKGGKLYLQFPYGERWIDTYQSAVYHRYTIAHLRNVLRKIGFQIDKEDYLDAEYKKELGYYFIAGK